MPQINLGTVANDGTGSPLRTGGQLINQYGLLGDKTVNAAFYKTASITNEAAITLAIAAAALLGTGAMVWIPTSMLPYSVSLVTLNTAVRMIREDGNPTVFDVKAYGAAGDGVTDDVLPIRAAIAAAAAVGGGVVYFPNSAIYALTAFSSSSFRVPVATATFQPQTQTMFYHILITSDNISLHGEGATLSSTMTGFDAFIICDGVRNFTSWGVNYTGKLTKNADGTANVQSGNALAFTSQTRASYNIRIEQAVCTGTYTAVYIFGDIANPRVQGVDIRDLRHTTGIYSIATHDNGDNVQARAVFCSNISREYFAYGVQLARVEISADGGGAPAHGLTPLIKAYDRDTQDIYFRLLTTRSVSGGVGQVDIGSQHSPGVQPIPKRVINLTVDLDNSGAASVAGVQFDYYRDNTPTATSVNNLFDGITLAGVHQQVPLVTVTQAGGSGVTSYGRVNTDKIVLLNGIIGTLYNTGGTSTGYADDKQSYTTFTPVLRINNSVTGITFGGATLGEYWRDGRFLEVLYHIVLTSKGVSVGGVTLDIPAPFVTATYVQGNAVVTGFGNVNMAGLTGPLTGYVQGGLGTIIQIAQQGATGITSLADTNLTNTSNFTIHARVPFN